MKKEKAYQEVNELKKAIQSLKGKKFQLHCGHHVTFGYNLGNDILIINGKNPKIVCSFCGY